MRVLLTRPRDEAAALAVELERRGHAVVRMPLLEIRHRAAAALDLSGAQAVLLTSANGARALARATAERGVAVYAVGEATAREATARGFAAVTSAGGDVARLAATVAGALDPGRGRLVHAGARHVAGDLAGALGARGFEVERAELYEAVPRTEIDPLVAAELRRRRLDAVLFFSPRSARAFVSLIRHAHLEDACANLEAICLSEAVADEIDAIAWHGVALAAHPDQASLLAALDRAAAVRS